MYFEVTSTEKCVLQIDTNLLNFKLMGIAIVPTKNQIAKRKEWSFTKMDQQLWIHSADVTILKVLLLCQRQNRAAIVFPHKRIVHAIRKNVKRILNFHQVSGRSSCEIFSWDDNRLPRQNSMKLSLLYRIKIFIVWIELSIIIL